MLKQRRPSARFVGLIDRIAELILAFLTRYVIEKVFGKLLDTLLKKSWKMLRPKFLGFVSKLTWFFPVGILVLTLQALIGLGYVASPTSFNVPIIDQFIFGMVTWMGLLLTGLGMSMGGSRRNFGGVLIVGSSRKH
jgi:hypothetical protein